MNSPARLLRAALFATAVASARGQGTTYPDGSVSPFKPTFFGVKIAENATSSSVFAVAANGGVYLGAVGQVTQVNENSTQVVPVFYTPGRGIVVLLPPQTNSGVAWGISGDGKIKVGSSESQGLYWDMSNGSHALPGDGGFFYPASALGISADGSVIAGYLVRYEEPAINEAALWTPGGSSPSKLGTLPGFENSFASAVSHDGQVACGHALHVEQTDDGTKLLYRGFRKAAGSPMQSVGSFSGDADSFAYGISEEGCCVVGRSGRTAYVWSDGRMRALERDSPGAETAAYAINLSSANPNFASGRIVGSQELPDGSSEAVMWETTVGKLVGDIKGLLRSRYGVVVGTWHLSIAYGMSADGYTICGDGINSAGQPEGWIAVLPPIQRPPRVINYNKLAYVKIGEPFSRSTEIQNGPVDSYSATGLPAGFQINSTTGVITGTWTDINAVSPGSYSVTVKATNSIGTGSGTFTLYLTPPSSFKKLIRGLGFLPASKPAPETISERSFGAGVSQDGRVAAAQDGSGNDARAFSRDADGGIQALPMLPGATRSYGTAVGVSANGNTIVGQAAAEPDANGNSRSVAVVWQNGAAPRPETDQLGIPDAGPTFTPTNIGLFAGGIVSTATGVSADGSVVVGYGDAKETGINYEIYQAFRWTAAGGLQGLGWIPGATKFSQARNISSDGSTIVGNANDNTSLANPTSVAFRWTEASGMVSIGRLPGGTSAVANAISADNATIVGESKVNSSDSHAFRWTAGSGMVDLGVLPDDTRSAANAVSADGAVIVGYSRNGFNAPRAFIWDAVNGMRDLKSVLVAGNPYLANWTLRSADGISADGKIITGDAINPNGVAEGFSAELNSVIVIESFSPPSGVPGTNVTIDGQRLADVGSVTFNGTSASFTPNSDEQLTATVPLGATTGPISVMSPSDTATSSAQFIVLADSDQDGMSDQFEQQYFGSPTAGNPNVDSDGDGLTNLQEYNAGTNPTDAKSSFRIIDIRKQGDDLVIVFQGIAHRRYRVEASTSLQNGYPIELETLGPSSTDVLHEVVDLGAATSALRYYRAVLLP